MRPSMSPRILQLPVSGRDRRHYVRELARVRGLHEALTKQAAAARGHAADLLRRANLLECEAWNARQFIGGPAQPSPTIAEAINAGCELLEVQCKRCGHTDHVDLIKVRRPRDRQIHTLQGAMDCRQCSHTSHWKPQANLVALCMRNPSDPDQPGAAAVLKGGGP